MFRKIRTSKFSHFIALFFCLIFLNSIFCQSLFALTSGPTLPEVQSFEPVNTNQMVDLFSGDFVYNIPLLELPGPNGGYPFNLSYHSGVGMDQEATWAGLGWSLNPGAIVRNVRGIPDDFNGDVISQELRMKQNETFGLDFGANVELFGGDLGLGLNMKFYYNNYKGVGYGFGLDASVPTSKASGLGLSVNTDSQGGAAINAQLSLSSHNDEYKGKFTLGIGLDSKDGLNLSLSGRVSTMETLKNEGGRLVDGNTVLSGSSSLSFAAQSYAPAIDHEMTGVNLSGNFKTGASFFGAFGDFNIGVFYNTEYIKNGSNIKNTPAYGYMNLQEPFKNGSRSLNTRGKNYLLDYNREKDGLITKNSPNLPIPFLTYDYYNLEGQGLNGMFRPFRSDIGHIHDPFIESKTNGGSIGTEFPVKHFGASGSYTNTTGTTSDLVKSDGSNNFYYTFTNQITNKLKYEPAYFKLHGEQSAVKTNELDFIGGEDAVYIPVKQGGLDLGVNPMRLKNNKNEISAGVLGNVRDGGERMPRENVIQSFTNQQIGTVAYSGLGEYNISYYTSSNYKTGVVETIGTKLDRSRRNNRDISKHIGGITALNGEGMRYVYALPAYNLEQREYLFSVDAETINNACASEFPLTGGKISYNVSGTDEYFKKTETPPYAHSYLLTSVLGSDYVDLTNNGPSDDDLGYWVKFNYVKENNYGWRSPYKNANYDPGLLSFKSDDKASFMYGSKEIWHLATVETKTHIAEFVISERHDGKGASEMNWSDKGVNHLTFNGNSYKIDEINIYVKKDYYKPSPVPIKTVHFAYSYELCPKVENNSTATEGKLTLKKLWFTYQNNTSGELNAYQFAYKASQNYEYAQNKYDRWGNYKGNGSECDRRNSPYVVQADYPERNDYASAWQLSSVTLPSGGIVNINYESDDYAYVQHRQATQMMEIASLKDPSGKSTVFDGSWNKGSMKGNKDMRRVYFNLQHPIQAASKTLADEIFKKKYIDGLARREGTETAYQIYFKVKSAIRGSIKEFVSGYADLDLMDGSEKLYGVVDDGGSTYSKGYITLKSFQVDKSKSKYYHPFAAAAWQFIRTNKPELITAPGTINAAPATSKMDKAMRAKSLLSVFNSIRDIFKDYTATAFDNRWGDKIELDNAWIRLCSPDKKKYGGGSRVKQITISDNWSGQTSGLEASAEYGQVYDYTMDEDGETISSGVATYEPSIGGDENPLRYAKKYANNVSLKSPNNLYFEYPINESLYPGPSVGYRKVTVRSLAGAAVKDDPAGNKRSTGGVSVNEFYTCKEFPVITEETSINNSKKPYDLVIPVPLLGTIETHNLTASQGYAIKLNDMHGKPKSVKNYALDEHGNMAQLINSTEYYYKKKSRMLDGVWVSETDNMVDVMLAHNPDAGYTTSKIEPRLLGTEYDFVSDMRFNKSLAVQGGVNVNVDLIIALFPIPIPVPWPIVNKSTRELKTAVTNKVVFKPGVLEKVVQSDGASTVTTKNVLFDEATGRPLLTTVTNNFDAPVYSLSLPAYKEYDEMGQAYQNSGLAFKGTVTNGTLPQTYLIVPENSGMINCLNEGDELVTGIIKLTVVEKNIGNIVAHTMGGLYGGAYDFVVSRPAKRNLLTASMGSLTALTNPTQNIATQQCSYNLNLPIADPIMKIELMPCAKDLVKMINVFLSTGINFLNDPVYSGLSYCEKGTFNKIEHSEGIGCQYKIIHFLDLYKNEGNINTKISGVWFYVNKPDNSTSYFLDSQNIQEVLDIFYIPKQYMCSEDLTGDFHIVGCSLKLKDGTVIKNANLFLETNLAPALPPAPSDRYNINYINKTITSNFYQLNNVLNIGYSSFSDLWNRDIPIGNPYQTGEKGIWISQKTFTYMADRSQGITLNVSTDGVMNNVPLANVSDPYFTLCKPQWKVTEEITKVSPHSKGVESRDILNRYSAALYGYSGGEVIVTAANAQADEIGYQGFDDVLTNTYTDASNFYFNSGNLGFASQVSSLAINRQYNVIVGNGRALIIDKPYVASDNISAISVHAFLKKTATRNTEYKVKKCYDLTVAEGQGIYAGKTAIALNDADATIFPDDRLWSGKVLVGENAVANAIASTVVNNNVHTGKYALYSDGGVCKQQGLKLKPGKEYILDFWMKSSVFSPSLIKCYDAGDNSIFDVTIGANDKVGKPLEGWQKVQKTFTMPQNANYISLSFATQSYIDDIRIYPSNSSIKTYVYNPQNLKLSAVLDENNYATFYYYDEQGNLFLIKKETADGIKTIQESRSHLPEQ